MADLDILTGTKNVRNAAAGVLFMQAGTLAMDVFSATNSSPWTAESFGGDEEKTAALWGYVRHAVAVSSFYAIGAAILAAGDLWKWPLIGAALGDIYMIWLYSRAVNRAKERGSTSWDD